MNKPMTVAKHYLSWHAKSLAFDLLLVVSMYVSGRIWDLERISFFIACTLLIKVVFGVLLRGNLKVGEYQQGATGQGRFNIKYFQGQPFSKRELPAALGLCSLINGLPFLAYIALFYPFIVDFLKFLPKEDFAPPLLLAASAIVGLGLSLWTLEASITFPRKLSQKKPKILNIFKRFNYVVFFGLIPLALIFAVKGAASMVKIPWLKPLIASVYFGLMWLKEPQNIVSVIFVASLLFLVWTYRGAINAWINERKSYVNVKKDMLVHGFLSLGLAGFLVFGDSFFGADYYKGQAQQLVKERNLEELKSLAQKEGVDALNVPNEYGLTPLLVAVHEGDVEMYRELKKLGAKHNDKLLENLPGHQGMDIVFLALDSHNIKMFEEILKEKPNAFNTVNKENGNTLLHYASHSCKIELVDYLLKKKLDPNVKNKSGQTPVHLAASKGCIAPIVSLYDSGARLDARDGKGRMALDYKAVKSNKELSYFLQKRTRLPASD